MKPLFKWSGGKSREIKNIAPHVPDKFDTYYEPFVGAGAVWLHLEHKKCVINDSYHDVANFYNVLKQDGPKLIERLSQITDEYNSSEKETKQQMELLSDKIYYRYRDSAPDNDFDKAVRFYILRQLSFSGMLRFNKDGKYNVPFGWYKKMKAIDFNQDKLSSLLEHTKILNVDWKMAVETANENDFVFLDPPYTRKFQKYHPNGEFESQHHIELASWFKNTSAKALIIINKDDFTHDLYKDFLVDQYDFKYSIQFRNRMTKKDSNTSHLMAKNY